MVAETSPLVEVIRYSGLEEVDTYITWRQNKFAQYIATWTILYMCEEEE